MPKKREAAPAKTRSKTTSKSVSLFQVIEQSTSCADEIASLLAAGADPNETNDAGEHALHVLATRGSDVDAAEHLLEAEGVSIDVRDKEGKTPLHRAVKSSYWNAAKFLRLLLEHGADVDAKDNAGKRAVDLAEGDHKELLLKHSEPPTPAKTLALLEAIGDDDAAAVKKLLAGGADACVVDTSDRRWGKNSLGGISPLHFAFARGVSRKVADAVLSAPKLDVNVQASDGRRPLHILLNFGQGSDRIELTEKLLALGAEPNAPDGKGRPPIFELTSFYKADGIIELFDLLVGAGADLAHRGQGGSTVLDSAFEATQRFHQVPDKAGLVRLIAHMVDAGAPTHAFKSKEIDAWLKDKGAKYLGGSKKKAAAKPAKPAKKAAASGALELFRTITGGKLEALTMKNAYLEIDGEKRSVALFDWFALGVGEDNDEHDFVSQIHEYHVPKHAAAHVEAERWIPFGVVGMTGALDSYEELRTQGTLFLDLSAAKGGDAPVVHTSRGDKRTAAAITKATKPTYAALMKTLSKKKG